MTLKSTILVTFLSLSIVAVPGAHHTFFSTYAETEVAFEEVMIVSVTWVNPHTIVSFDAADDTGKVTRWVTETGSPSSLTRLGWNRNSVSSGDVVAVVVNPARDGTPRGHLALVRLPDGTVFDRRGTVQ